MAKHIDINNDLRDDAACGITDEAAGGESKKQESNRGIALTIREWKKIEEVQLRANPDDTLGEVLGDGAQALGRRILPPGPAAPLDLLRGQLHNGVWSEPITDLSQILRRALNKQFNKEFAIEFRLIVKINALWGLAPAKEVTPRQLLAAFGMDASEFTLYPPDSETEYPADTPIQLKRGDKFEAQKDGRYGDTVATARKPRGSQSINDDVKEYQEAGATARLFSFNGQTYVEVNHIRIPSPPWNKRHADILIAVPATYPAGGLDAFYVRMPIAHESGDVPRKQNMLEINGDQWLLISWHYHPNKPWNPAQDDLVTHVEQCRGFFLMRGVKE